MRIEVVIPTKDRYENLALLIWSLLEQTYKNWVVTIIDDSERSLDIRKLPFILPMLKRMDNENHDWRVLFGDKKGPHYCHQLGLAESRHPFIFRVDDDCILDFRALEYLVAAWQFFGSKQIGAIGPIVFNPEIPKDHAVLPIGYKIFKRFRGKIDEYGVTFGDQQWRPHLDSNLQAVEHLYSSFLYSKEAAEKIGGYELGYNVVGHREETDFTYRLFKNGYLLFIQPLALVSHLRNPYGGIRTFKDASLWEECHNFYLQKFGFKRGKNKDKVLKIIGGLGDHLCATPTLRSLRRKGGKVVLSPIYPYLFQENPNVDELIFNEDEKEYENVILKDVYKWAADNQFKGNLTQAFAKCFDVKLDNENLDYFIFPEERGWVNKVLEKLNCATGKYVLISPYSGVSVIQYIGTTKTGAGGKRTSVKDWFDDRWEILVKRIKKLGFQVYQVGGAKDKEIKGCDAYFLGQGYRESVALLEQSAGLISVDSFMQHAAFAIKKKSVVLFGATDPKVFGHSFHNIIYYPKSCNRKKECLRGAPWMTQARDCKYLDCMKKITVKEVLDNLKMVIKENKSVYLERKEVESC